MFSSFFRRSARRGPTPFRYSTGLDNMADGAVMKRRFEQIYRRRINLSPCLLEVISPRQEIVCLGNSA